MGKHWENGGKQTYKKHGKQMEQIRKEKKRGKTTETKTEYRMENNGNN